jgi:type IV pilus assembly protein PilX
MKISNRSLRAATAPRNQRGVVLLISLILLIALTLSGIALFRQVGTGVLIASNLTFKNAALVASDRGIEVARNWLVTSGANLQQASLANGYFPGWCNTSISASNVPDANNDGVTDDCKTSPPPSEFNPLTYNWANSVLATADDGSGNAIRYVIHRLCRIPGSLNFTNSDGVPQECVTLGSTTTGGTKGAVAYGGGALANTMQPYFRITTQTTGPKNTIAYSQVIMY